MDVLDPLVLAVVEGSVSSALREVEAQVQRTARSANIREISDHCPAIYDAAGRLLGSVAFPAGVDPVLTVFGDDIAEGDVFLWNHPYESGGGIGHLPDLCFTLPVFSAGRLVAFVQELAHVQDIGGMVAGSLPSTTTELYQEGLILPPVKLVDRGRRNDAVLAIVRANNRYPAELDGDIDALVNGCRIGVARLQGLCRRYGADVVEQAFAAMRDRCRRVLLEDVLPRIPDGSYRFTDFLEYVDVVEEEPRRFIGITMTLHKRADGVECDFTGTDAQVAGALNFPVDERYYARGFVTTLKALEPDLPVNDGLLDVVSVRLPRGTVLSPEFPAACAGCAWAFMRVFNVMLATLARALDGDVPQGADSLSSYNLRGVHPDTGQPWHVLVSLAGGSGGRPFADGNEAAHPTHGRNVPVEYLEAHYPVIAESLELVPDTGGAGRHRGGNSSRLALRLLARSQLRLRTDRGYLQAAGVKGGAAGAPAVFLLNPGTAGARVLPGKSGDVYAEAGDVLVVSSPGGAGWGDPLERDRTLVERDLADGAITAAAATEVYGVVPGDAGATAALRERLAAARGPLAMFDRGAGFAAHLRAGDLTLAEG